MNGKSSSNPSQDCPDFPLSEYLLRNKRRAEVGVSLDGRHPFKERLKDQSSDKSSDNNYNYKHSVKFCMYCKKSLSRVPEREKRKSVEGWYHKKCRPTQPPHNRLQTLKNKLWLKMNNKSDSLGAEGTDHNSEEQNESKDSNQLNSGLDLESINNCKEELTIESTNVSLSCGKVIKYRHVCAYKGCGKRFAHPALLIDHIRSKHTFEKPFKCKECDERFYTKEKLKKHFNIHLCERNPELRVKCDFKNCEKYFYTQYSMRRHKKRNHSIERWTCDWPECGRVYKQKIDFDDHIRAHLGHKQFQCKYEGCAKRFYAKKYLKLHHYTHSKRFVCSWPECNDRFTMKMSLTSHLNKHQNIKPFKCTFQWLWESLLW